MKITYWINVPHVVLLSFCIQTCVAECSGDHRNDSQCWYTLWYIWFIIVLFVIVITVLVILYIKHRSKELSRSRRHRRSTRTIPIHIVPTGPPDYAEPSHKPPSYDEATRQQPGTTNAIHVPGIIPYYNDDYGYQPPPTSMRMVVDPTQPLPPPYDASTQGHSHPS